MPVVVVVSLGIRVSFERPTLAAGTCVRVAVVQLRVPDSVGVAATVHALTWERSMYALDLSAVDHTVAGTPRRAQAGFEMVFESTESRCEAELLGSDQ